jgi:outer membrane protein assembly factor BamB
MTADGAMAAGEAEVPVVRPPVWLPGTLVGLYWAFVGVSSLAEMPTFYRFMSQAALLLVVILVFLIWWGFNRRVRLRDRLLVLGVAIVSPIVATMLAHKTLGPITIFNGLPVMFTAWAVWLVIARKAPLRLWNGGLIAVLFLSMGAFLLFRMEGLKGAGAADLRWRWSKTPEERYLAERSGAVRTSAQSQPVALLLRPGDWPGFRGAARDSVVRGVTISTDWAKNPPRQVWRRPIGPGWSSMCVVDGRLFTQEQRGEKEAVACLDAASGSEVWSDEEPGRFWDPLSSTGPRATPTFSDGRIYAQGAMGTLVCLDAASGRKIWSRDVLADSGGKLPDWGVASSPLVTHGIVIVYGEGHGDKGLLGYRRETGDLAWSVNAGVTSYTSPQLATIGGREQVLFISDKGLVSVDPETGKTLWEYASAGQPPRSLQPRMVGENRILVPLGMEQPTDLVEVKQAGDAFSASKLWASRNLKPSFNDFVVHGDYIYGFDGSIFSCVDLKTGERKWKKGRYGTGQVLLLADQGLLLVTTDQGEVALVSAKPDQFEELGRFEAISGKTWNHPAVARGRLYVRNSQEIACFELADAARK